MTKNKNLFSEYAGLFRCPLCTSPMRLVDLKSLICTNHHCFDLAKKGYVNFSTRPLQTKYDRQMFSSRRVIQEKGLFSLLDTKISEIILDQIIHNKIMPFRKTAVILDAGCGEGSHLPAVLEKLAQSSRMDFIGVGLDISKEGILMAASKYKHCLWCVGDLARSPFTGQQFDFILNILTPANYADFKRILAPGGTVIKVIPNQDYLRELRNIFYDQTSKQTYSSNDILQLFKSKFKTVTKKRLKYSAALNRTWIEPLVHMTPLSWGITEERRQQVLQMNLKEITVDLTILVGKG